MAKFKFEAMAVSGDKIQGELVAVDEANLIDILRNDGYYLLNCSKSGKEGKASTARIKTKPLAIFCSQLSSMLRAGIPISKCLEIMRDQTEDLGLKHMLGEVSTSVVQGSSLTEAFQPHRERVPQLLLNMMETGEATGNLDMSMFRAGEAFTRLAKINGKVVSGMVYPLAIVFLLLAVVTFLMAFVVPQFVQIFETAGADLPRITQILISVSNFIVTRWYVILIVVGGIFGSIRYTLSTDQGRTKWDSTKLKLPVLGVLLRKIYASRFARSFASMTTAGVPIVQCVRVTARTVQNRYIEKLLYEAVAAVEQGGSIGVQLEKMNVFPPVLVYITKVGEETGSMEELYLKTADFFDEEADNAVTSMISLMQPAIIVGLVVLVAPILIGIITPMFSMFGAMLG
jgi:type IV pilus assembly protein PilC